ncbi:tail fiber protein [Paenibacillus sp. FSL k6-2145]|uniref:tail fiber protein n=1 Tax=Paenibacillus sp. FSL k6-2145 TaxID=2976834 RepID=UPI0030D86048
MLETMYPAAVNSKQTELAEAIDDTQTSFTVLDGSVLPPAPNLITLGTDESAETVLYTEKTGNEITGVTRGFESGAVSWAAGTKLARFFTAHDHDTFRENIADLDQRLSDIVIPPASLTEQGIVMLSNSTTGNRDDVAATESAVAEAFQYGVERKAEVVAALNSIGVSASTSDSWDSLIAKMSGVIRATGTAAVSQVLAGATFSNATGNNRTGTMVNNGAGGTVTPGTTNQTKAAGYYSSAMTILGSANLLAANIKNGVNIFGVIGTLNEGVRYASGTSSFSTTSVLFRKTTTEMAYAYVLEVNGLAFKPKMIVITMEAAVGLTSGSGAYPQSTVYTERPIRTSGAYSGMSTVTMTNGDRFYVEGEYAFVSATGFRLPIYVTHTNYNLTWYAFDI